MVSGLLGYWLWRLPAFGHVPKLKADVAAWTPRILPIKLSTVVFLVLADAIHDHAIIRAFQSNWFAIERINWQLGNESSLYESLN